MAAPAVEGYASLAAAPGVDAGGSRDGASGSAPRQYPAARASHDEVVASGALFLETLSEAYAALGLVPDKIPKLGGRDLDLHQLYASVTALGGCERVISRKLWREAAAPFHLAPTITSVSYILRKTYVSHLWDYEQMYFFRKTGPVISPPASTGREERGDVATPNKRAKICKDKVMTEFPPLPFNSPNALTAVAFEPGEPSSVVVGTRGVVMVDARFDCGYFVTLKLGKKEFRGLLYYPPAEHTTKLQSPSTSMQGDAVDHEHALSPSDKKKSKTERNKDPLAPKTNKTPFNFFAINARSRVRKANPNISQSELTKKIGEMWQNTGEFEKAPYLEIASQDKARYRAELEAYNYRLAAQHAQVTAMQAAQAVHLGASALSSDPQIPGGHPVESKGIAEDADTSKVSNSPQYMEVANGMGR